MTLIWFLFCGEVQKAFLSGNGVSQSSFCTSLVWLQLPKLLSLIVDFNTPRQRHTCHGCPKLALWHFYKVWKNKWWTSTLLIVAKLLSQPALELAQSLHLELACIQALHLLDYLNLGPDVLKCFQKEEYFTLQWSWFFEMCNNLHMESLLNAVMNSITRIIIMSRIPNHPLECYCAKSYQSESVAY